MVKLRLKRKGRIHHPFYDIVAIDSKKKRDGAFIERLGWYDPHYQPSKVSLNSDRAIYWLNVGAQPTDIVRRLLSYEGILLKRALSFKGKTAEEIETAVEQHKTLANDRYFKRKEQRKARKVAKVKAEEDAKKKEAEAAAAPAPAETPAE